MISIIYKISVSLKITRNFRNLFRLEKEIDYNTVKDIGNLSTLKFGKKKSIKDRIEQLEILGTFLSIKKKFFINQ